MLSVLLQDVVIGECRSHEAHSYHYPIDHQTLSSDVISIDIILPNIDTEAVFAFLSSMLLSESVATTVKLRGPGVCSLSIAAATYISPEVALIWKLV